LSALLSELVKINTRGKEMKGIEHYKDVFEQYGGIMRTKDLQAEKIFYRNIQGLVEEGAVEKVRFGYYQWVDEDDFSEVGTIIRLFPDGIFCMETALRYYDYSDRTPAKWHMAVSKDSGKSRFNIDYPFVKPYYLEPSVLSCGVTSGFFDGHEIRIYDKERVICDCLRYRNKMDKEIFNKAIQNYIKDSTKNISKLIEYSEVLRVKKIAKDLIGVWL
jgi:predicted transcriptional regulator of viral defense system